MIFPIDRALTDPNLLAGFIQTDSWGAWLTCWRSVFALPPQDGDLELFKRCTGRDTWPTDPAKEIYIIAGRRSGKSHNASLLACYLAAFREYPLAKGEQAVIGIVSPTKQQARIIKQYANAPFRENPLLQPLVLRETAYEVELTNGVSIMIMPADQRSTRGFTAAAVILDESAFFSIENARSDIEIVRCLAAGIGYPRRHPGSDFQPATPRAAICITCGSSITAKTATPWFGLPIAAR